ncbi:MAG: nitroreductase family deazaflavin-dependent oxidoreductase [Chloroflexota bacterium]|nr:nitroreductase family deazaflavin-dependent oxidoreductase [Chloroflexota bacterium]MDE2886391.1 nitroreductase family deazaflavin-dependent oxidoreductase [Chloroflexota bacterium]
MTTSGSGKPPWVVEHLERYLATDGEEGHVWRGMQTLLLTTTGRKSGKEFTTPLIYGTHEGRWIVVASRGGAPDHPQWYYNLSANPSVRVQVGAERFDATASTAGPDEKPALWQLMNGVYPRYDEYQAGTERQIPVVILERAG